MRTGLIKQAIENWWGPRCPDYCEDCDCCLAWHQLDVLLAELADYKLAAEVEARCADEARAELASPEATDEKAK